MTTVTGTGGAAARTRTPAPRSAQPAAATPTTTSAARTASAAPTRDAKRGASDATGTTPLQVRMPEPRPASAPARAAAAKGAPSSPTPTPAPAEREPERAANDVAVLDAIPAEEKTRIRAAQTELGERIAAQPKRTDGWGALGVAREQQEHWAEHDTYVDPRTDLAWSATYDAGRSKVVLERVETGVPLAQEEGDAPDGRVETRRVVELDGSYEETTTAITASGEELGTERRAVAADGRVTGTWRERTAVEETEGGRTETTTSTEHRDGRATSITTETTSRSTAEDGAQTSSSSTSVAELDEQGRPVRVEVDTTTRATATSGGTQTVVVDESSTVYENGGDPVDESTSGGGTLTRTTTITDPDGGIDGNERETVVTSRATGDPASPVWSGSTVVDTMHASDGHERTTATFDATDLETTGMPKAGADPASTEQENTRPDTRSNWNKFTDFVGDAWDWAWSLPGKAWDGAVDAAQYVGGFAEGAFKQAVNVANREHGIDPSSTAGGGQMFEPRGNAEGTGADFVDWVLRRDEVAEPPTNPEDLELLATTTAKVDVEGGTTEVTFDADATGVNWRGTAEFPIPEDERAAGEHSSMPVAVYVDGEYHATVLALSERNGSASAYGVSLGSLPPGEHEIDLRLHPTAPGGGSVEIANVEARTRYGGANDDEAAARRHQPILEMEELDNDIPLAMTSSVAEFDPEKVPDGVDLGDATPDRVITYTVVNSSEDGGTAHADLLDYYGRTLDVGGLVRVYVDANGNAVHTAYEAAGHNWHSVDSEAEYRGDRVVLAFATDNNMLSSRLQGGDLYSPTLDETTAGRDFELLVENPWMAQVGASEAEREDSQDLHWDSYVFVPDTKDPAGARLFNDGRLTLRLRDGSTIDVAAPPRPTDSAPRENGGSGARTTARAVQLPEGVRPDDVVGLVGEGRVMVLDEDLAPRVISGV